MPQLEPRRVPVSPPHSDPLTPLPNYPSVSLPPTKYEEFGTISNFHVSVSTVFITSAAKLCYEYCFIYKNMLTRKMKYSRNNE